MNFIGDESYRSCLEVIEVMVFCHCSEDFITASPQSEFQCVLKQSDAALGTDPSSLRDPLVPRSEVHIGMVHIG